jgi:hypothetical protein
VGERFSAEIFYVHSRYGMLGIQQQLQQPTTQHVEVIVQDDQGRAAAPPARRSGRSPETMGGSTKYICLEILAFVEANKEGFSSIMWHVILFVTTRAGGIRQSLPSPGLVVPPWPEEPAVLPAGRPTASCSGDPTMGWWGSVGGGGAPPLTPLINSNEREL